MSREARQTSFRWCFVCFALLTPESDRGKLWVVWGQCAVDQFLDFRVIAFLFTAPTFSHRYTSVSKMLSRNHQATAESGRLVDKHTEAGRSAMGRNPLTQKMWNCTRQRTPSHTCRSKEPFVLHFFSWAFTELYAVHVKSNLRLFVASLQISYRCKKSSQQMLES